MNVNFVAGLLGSSAKSCETSTSVAAISAGEIVNGISHVPGYAPVPVILTTAAPASTLLSYVTLYEPSGREEDTFGLMADPV